MANIRVDVSHTIKDGSEVVFSAPCDCDKVDSLVVYHPGGANVFTFSDAHRNFLKRLGNLFLEDTLVKVILDVTKGFAYIQNADTNGYLEGRFAQLGVEDSAHPGCFYRMFNGIKEWINPPMMDGVEYRLTKRYNGKPVYAMSREFGALPNTGNTTVALSTDNSKIDDYLALDVFAKGAVDSNLGNKYKLPFYNSTGELKAFYRTMGDRSIWIATTDDLSGYNGRVAGEYTKV